jgi:hypothetical protein
MILESTAKADTGTYFKKLCELAQQGKTSYNFFFVGWLSDNTLVRDLKVPVKDFVESFSEYDGFLWDSGATLEQIAWYRNQKSKPGYVTRDYSIKEEYPTTAQEAFQTGANRVFPAVYVHRLRKECLEPKAVGELYADANEGHAAIQGIHFEPETRGRLSIWRFPDDDYGGAVDPAMRYVNRFFAALDVGGSWSGADYHNCAIMDCFPVLMGDLPEIVAEWHGHEDPDKFAWIAARMAQWYDRAELIPESNKWEQTPHADESNLIAPDETLTILDAIMQVYPRLYMRQVLDVRTQQPTAKVGFHMNEQTKAMIISSLRSRMRHLLEDTGGYRERSYGACSEMDTYLNTLKGSRTVQAAAAGRNDDRVIVRGILSWRLDNITPIKAIPKKQTIVKRAAHFAKF